MLKDYSQLSIVTHAVFSLFFLLLFFLKLVIVLLPPSVLLHPLHPLPTADFSMKSLTRGNLSSPVLSPGVIRPGDFRVPPAWTCCSLYHPVVILRLHLAAVFKIPFAFLRSAGLLSRISGLSLPRGTAWRWECTGFPPSSSMRRLWLFLKKGLEW